MLILLTYNTNKLTMRPPCPYFSLLFSFTTSINEIQELFFTGNVSTCSRHCCQDHPGRFDFENKFGGVLYVTQQVLLGFILHPYLIDVDELQNHGINAADITKLKQAGVCTIKARSSSGNVFVDFCTLFGKSLSPNRNHLSTPFSVSK